MTRHCGGRRRGACREAFRQIDGLTGPGRMASRSKGLTWTFC
jgi:hypothetical protein